MENLKQNEKIVLQIIQQYTTVSKRFLQKETNLSWASVVRTIASLREKKFIQEAGEIENNTQQGKNATAYKINPHFPLFLGIDIAHYRTNAILFNLNYEARCEFNYTMSKPETAEDLIPFLKKIVQYFEQKYTGIQAASLILPLNLKKDIENLDTFPIQFSFPVHMQTIAPSYAHFLLTKTGIPNDFLLVTLRSGINSAIVIGKKLLSLPNPSAGEIGHIVVDPTSIIKCRCGKMGCLESYLNLEKIDEKISPHFKSISHFLAQLNENNPIAQKIFMEISHSFLFILESICASLGLRTVIIASSLGQNASFFIQSLKENLPTDLQLLYYEMEEKDILRGTVASGMNFAKGI